MSEPAGSCIRQTGTPSFTAVASAPGFGFGKDLAENRAVLRALPRVAAIAPVLVGLSRKRMTGEPWGLPVDGRLYTSVALALAAIDGGAQVVRVHDVRATREAVRAWEWVFEP